MTRKRRKGRRQRTQKEISQAIIELSVITEVALEVRCHEYEMGSFIRFSFLVYGYLRMVTEKLKGTWTLFVSCDAIRKAVKW